MSERNAFYKDTLARGIKALNARPWVDGEYVYYASETGSDWIISEDAVADLGRRMREIDCERLPNDEYSKWCQIWWGREVKKR